MNEIDRREALKILGLSLLSVGTGSAVIYRSADCSGGDDSASRLPTGEKSPASARQGAEPEPAPWWLLEPFTAGTVVGTCRIVSMSSVSDGVVTLGLQSEDGERFDVAICRRDDSSSAPTPIARTEYYDFFLPNGGKGDMPTDEANGRVVMALGILAERNEKGQARLPLQTLRQHWLRG